MSNNWIGTTNLKCPYKDIGIQLDAFTSKYSAKQGLGGVVPLQSKTNSIP